MNIKTFLFAVCLMSFSFSSANDSHFSLFISGFKTAEMPLNREIYVYLPPGYSQNPLTNYPVLYMHDGQNLFDPARAYLGQTWNAENTLNDSINSGKMEPVIVVAIDCTSDRVDEYTYDIDSSLKEGGKAAAYVEMIVSDIKPKVDQTFRTLKTRAFTSIAGSSLGGLVSLYAAYKYPQVFGRVAAFSPSIWWNNKSIIELYKQASVFPMKVYLDSGTMGGDRPDDVYSFRDSIVMNYADPQNIYVVVQQGGDHNEKYWAQRLPGALQFLFPVN